MTSLPIASSSVRYSLMETGSLWLLSLRKKSISTAAIVGIVIRLSQLTLRRGAKPLLEAAELTVYAGERIGLIGANGSGKSSLFALLRDELHADKGDVDLPAHWRVAHVAQETPALDRPAVEYAIDGDTKLRGLQAELEETHDGTRIGELHAALADADLYTAR